MKEQKRMTSDPWVALMAIFATVLGVLTIWDAGYSRSAANGQVFPRELIFQGVFMIVALLAGLVISSSSASSWKKATHWIVGGSVFLMCLVEVPGIGKEINHAKRWIGIGNFLTIQPAEFVKIGALLAVSYVIANWSSLRLRKSLAPALKFDVAVRHYVRKCWPLALVAVSFLLLEKERDLGTAAVIGSSLIAVLVAANVKAKVLVPILACCALGAGLLITKEGYRSSRIFNHAHRWDKGVRDDLGYQTTQSEIAMSRGGLTGVGFGNGRAKHKLPAPTTDFVFATLAEEFGLVGSMVCLGLLGCLALRLLWLGLRLRDSFARYVHVGVAAWLAIQTSTNVAMANGALPPIGIPLPFFSYGGSSLIALWAAIGICQSLQREKRVGEVTEEDGAHDRNGWRNRRPHLSGA